MNDDGFMTNAPDQTNPNKKSLQKSATTVKGNKKPKKSDDNLTSQKKLKFQGS